MSSKSIDTLAKLHDVATVIASLKRLASKKVRDGMTKKPRTESLSKD